MKKEYQQPKIEKIWFDAEDVIVTSGGSTNDTEELVPPMQSTWNS